MYYYLRRPNQWRIQDLNVGGGGDSLPMALHVPLDPVPVGTWAPQIFFLWVEGDRPYRPLDPPLGLITRCVRDSTEVHCTRDAWWLLQQNCLWHCDTVTAWHWDVPMKNVLFRCYQWSWGKYLDQAIYTVSTNRWLIWLWIPSLRGR